jgi:hypothetical protein
MYDYFNNNNKFWYVFNTFTFVVAIYLQRLIFGHPGALDIVYLYSGGSVFVLLFYTVDKIVKIRYI